VWLTMMRNLLLILLLLTLLPAWGAGGSTLARPVWEFRVLVGVEKRTADYYQQLYGRDIRTTVRQQLAQVNANFNSSDRFEGTFDFRADSIYVFDGNTAGEVFRPHPGFAYKVIIDGFATTTAGGGWYGSFATIFHKWDWNQWGGPFAKYATDGLTHEFGHARGAVDLYALKVEAAKNEVNGQAFQPVNSIMDYPYDNIAWDEYTVHLLNRTGSGLIPDESYITSAFPAKIQVQAVDRNGAPMEQVRVELFPVNWFSYAVPSVSLSLFSPFTNRQGTYTFYSNPFEPASVGHPWHIRYPNFLVRATYHSSTVYQWLPLYEVQNEFFRNGPESTYTLRLQFPQETETLRITALSDSVLCAGGEVTVSLATTGTFLPITVTRLELSDPNGQFSNATSLAEVTGTGFNSLSGTLPPDLVPGSTYRLRLRSVVPFVTSESIPLTVLGLPATPTVAGLRACVGAAATPLPEDEQLRWYLSDSATALPVARPVVSTDQAGQWTYYVSQVGNGCESTRAALSVTVHPRPEKPGVAAEGPVYCQQSTSQSLEATGEALQWYAVPDGGAPLGAAFAPPTNQPGTFTYYVSQQVNGCESDRAALAVTILPLPTATLSGSQSILEGETARLSVAFTGQGPWSFSYRDSSSTGLGAEQTVQTATNPHPLPVQPRLTTGYYLMAVGNSCGSRVPARVTVLVTVVPLLGLPSGAAAEAVVYPVPARNEVEVLLPQGRWPATLEVLNSRGQVLLTYPATQPTTLLPLHQLPAGTYLLRIRSGTVQSVHRLVKQ
jgi:hypothetical protein